MCWCCDDTNGWCVLWEVSGWLLLNLGSLRSLLLGLSSCFSFFVTVFLVLKRHRYLRAFLQLDFFTLLFVVYRNWSILTLSWLDLISSWCSNMLYCHMRPASEYLLNRTWASHNELYLNEQSKNGNYGNVILNVTVSHNLFVSNRMPFGDCLKIWWEEYGTYRITFAHGEQTTDALQVSKRCVTQQEVCWQSWLQKQWRNWVCSLRLETQKSEYSYAPFSFLDSSIIFKERKVYSALWSRKSCTSILIWK